ncbi:MAG: Na+/H+ antiporter subunit E [Actinomycetota bacterium]|nr:Na+/H+ antiporter subunit E [Actinomycetota bacterium]MDZ4201115.1 Na+/H+ antiporter subunit E [Gallionella sp.]
MQRVLSFTLLFTTLFLFWVWLNNSLAGDVVIVGLMASLIIAWMFRDGLSAFSDLHPTPRAIAYSAMYIFFFFKELVKSNLSLAAIVLTPGLPLTPGIVKVRTRLKSRMGRMLLANSISLTPGTLTVEMTGEWLYIHCVTVNSTDTDLATANIVAGFERYLEVMYG